MGKTLLEVVIPGRGSLTDSTLYRRFSASHPEQVVFESNSLVYINSDLPVIDAVLDLSHELTHFVYRKAFNPYKDSFNVKEFITATIEGSGGEVDAFLNECRVLKELFNKSNSSRYHCHLIKDHDGDLSRRLAKFHFYKVGQGHHYLKENLHKKGHEIQYLSDENPVFISSTYGDSYPMAAYKEYITVKEKACKNEGRRVSYIKQATGRSPAYVKKTYQRIINSYESKCLLAVRFFVAFSAPSIPISYLFGFL